MNADPRLLSGTGGKQDSATLWKRPDFQLRSFPGPVMGTLGRCWAAGTTAPISHKLKRQQPIMHMAELLSYVFCGSGIKCIFRLGICNLGKNYQTAALSSSQDASVFLFSHRQNKQ